MLSEVGGLKSFSKPTLETTYTRKTFFFFFFKQLFCTYKFLKFIPVSACVCVCLCICVCILGACVRFI